jgi:hypothetical protein
VRFRRALAQAWRQEAGGPSAETHVVDRALIFVLVIAIGCLMLAGLWTKRAYLAPVLVSGKNFESLIDGEIADMTAARNPSVSVGHAHCPFFLDLTEARVVRCTLPVSDAQMSIRVATDDTQHPVVVSENALIVLPDAERRIAGLLELQYGERFDVHCPGSRVRLINNDDSFVCWVAAADVERRRLEVDVSGSDLGPRALKHVPTRLERLFGRAVAEQRSGGVELAGPVVETYVRGSAAGQGKGEMGRRGLVGRAHCPRVVALHGRSHVRCTVQVGGPAEIYDARFDEGRGLEIEAQSTAIVLPAVREVAERYFERTWDTGGKPFRAVVDCGRQSVALVEPGAFVPCTATIGGDKANFAIRVLDQQGSYDFVGRD